MTPIIKFLPDESFIRENRMIFMVNSPHLNGLALGPHESMKSWRDSHPESKEMIDFFAKNKNPITKEGLKNYVFDPTRIPLPRELVEELQTLFSDLSSANLQERLDAEAGIEKMLEFLREEQAVIKETREKLAKTRGEAGFLDGKSIETTFNTVSNKLGEVTDAFWEADGKDKAIMLAGAAALFLAGRSIWRYFDGKWASRIKKGIFFAGSVGISIMAIDAVNRVFQKTYGRPFMALNTLNFYEVGLPLTDRVLPIPYPEFPILKSQKEWEARAHKEEIERVAKELENMELPDQFVSKLNLPGTNTTKHVKGLINILPMSISQLKDLYENNALTREISSSNRYYRNKFKSDGMTDSERFILVEKIVEALNMKDANGLFVTGPEFDKKKDFSVLYLAVNI